MKKNYPPNWTYADFAPEFTAEFYDPDQWDDDIRGNDEPYGEGYDSDPEEATWPSFDGSISDYHGHSSDEEDFP